MGGGKQVWWRGGGVSVVGEAQEEGKRRRSGALVARGPISS